MYVSIGIYTYNLKAFCKAWIVSLSYMYVMVKEPLQVHYVICSAKAEVEMSYVIGQELYEFYTQHWKYSIVAVPLIHLHK